MNFKGKKATKVCNFYVNNWHLLTMLFPYLNKNVSAKTSVITVLEEDIEKYAETLIGKIILNNRDKEKIMNINWGSVDIQNEKFDEYLKSNIVKNNELIIIVNGSINYIENANVVISNLINKKEISNKNIKIINCYDISDENINMNNILNGHENVLNTLGETKVEEFACSSK